MPVFLDSLSIPVLHPVPWELLDNAPVPGEDQELRLNKRGDEFSIRLGGREIMNSRAHGSEDALAERAWERIAGRSKPCILVGGLGLGFTAAAALQRIGPGGRVVVVAPHGFSSE